MATIKGLNPTQMERYWKENLRFEARDHMYHPLNHVRTQPKGDRQTFYKHVWPMLNQRYERAAGMPSQLVTCARVNLPDKPLVPPMPYRSPSTIDDRHDKHAMHPLVPDPGKPFDPKIIFDDAKQKRAFNAKSRITAAMVRDSAV
jgi:hypothetical protein